jgi:hypothetical protein
VVPPKVGLSTLVISSRVILASAKGGATATSATSATSGQA